MVAGNEAGACNLIRCFNRILGKTQVRNGNTTRFFGIVDEVSLTIIIITVGNNFNGVLVGTDRTVCTQAHKDTTGDIAFNIKRRIVC